MKVPSTHQAQMVFIQSEDVFQQAKRRALWEVSRSLLRRSEPYLPTVDPIEYRFHHLPSTYMGVQDIQLDQILGTTWRHRPGQWRKRDGLRLVKWP